MKQLVFLEVVKRLRFDPGFRRWLKFGLAVGAVGTLIVGALVIWAGIAGFKFVLGFAQEAQVAAQVEKFKAEIPEMPAVAKLGCLKTAQNLIGVEPWLEKPISENFRNLKVACLESMEPPCAGTACDAARQDSSTTGQGEKI